MPGSSPFHSGLDGDELVAKLRECQQPPLHLLGIGGVASPNTGVQGVEPVGFSLDEATSFLALTLSQGPQKSCLRIEGSLEAQAAGDGGVRLARVAEF